MALLPVHLPILMYHQIMPESHPDFKKHIATTPENFRHQVTHLMENGWTIMTLEEYFAHPPGKRPKKAAMLTFDDVCKNFIEYAVPIFKELNVRANIFPIQNMTFNLPFHNLKPQGIPALTEQDIKDLDQMGFAIGSHCQSHQNLHKIPFDQAKKELKESKEWLEGLLGKEVKTICYPIGGIDRDIVNAAKEIGYSIGISTLKGSLQILETDLMSLRRVDIKNHVIGKKLKFAISPFYGFRRFITRPIRSKYRVSGRHPSVVGK
ncbi:polysaccharide deacetylase family protein [Peredibacter sp. HCB2-198]|uniref:polysaccharide deacetylase family protein n=1 Tax=Peredibacter sp. HCB2-198 TaxID=3383025 RepID=UPI0038B65A4E